MIGIGKIIKRLAKIFKATPDTDFYRFYNVEKANPITTTKTEYIEEYASPVSSFSTMATMDDNPGTGRVIDKYAIQPLTKKLERFVGRAFGPHFVPGHRIGQRLQELIMEYRGAEMRDRAGVEGEIIRGLNRLLCDYK